MQEMLGWQTQALSALNIRKISGRLTLAEVRLKFVKSKKEDKMVYFYFLIIGVNTLGL